MGITMKRRLWIVIGATVIVLSITNSDLVAAAPPPLNARDVLADVQAHGARATVASLWADTDRWNHVLAEIGKGSREWLQVAAALHKGTDAGASEELDQSMFLALKYSPIVVLQLTKKKYFDVDAVCNGNIADDYPSAESKRFLAQRIAVLSRLSDPTTSTVRNECIKGLRDALADFH